MFPDTVVLAGLGGLKDDAENLESEVRLLYVGMTRAREQLLLTGSGGGLVCGAYGWVVGLWHGAGPDPIVR